MLNPIDSQLRATLHDRFVALESFLGADLFTYYGPITDGGEGAILNLIEEIANEPTKQEKLFVLLTTPGGSAIAVERYVNIIRHHYNEVSFIVPDYAYSAGTIFCMSGDHIFMDYSSALGPIDPQVLNKEGKWVAALGYLDKVNDLIKKAQEGTLTNAEFLILKDMDLAELRGYEQAKELTIDLLKKWLVKYKFKNWKEHATNPDKLGTPVTDDEKKERAEEVANALSNNNLWKSHGRPINIETLESRLRLKIEDYSKNQELRTLVRGYYELLHDYINQRRFNNFVQTRKFN